MPVPGLPEAVQEAEEVPQEGAVLHRQSRNSPCVQHVHCIMIETPDIVWPVGGNWWRKRSVVYNDTLHNDRDSRIS